MKCDRDCFNKKDEITFEVQINEGNAHHHPSIGVRGYFGDLPINLSFKFNDVQKINSEQISFALNHIQILLQKLYKAKIGE